MSALNGGDPVVRRRGLVGRRFDAGRGLNLGGTLTIRPCGLLGPEGAVGAQRPWPRRMVSVGDLFNAVGAKRSIRRFGRAGGLAGDRRRYRFA
jgi:hypothetical protein